MDFQVFPWVEHVEPSVVEASEYDNSQRYGFTAMGVICLFSIFFTIGWKIVSHIRDHLKWNVGDSFSIASFLFAIGFTTACASSFKVAHDAYEGMTSSQIHDRLDQYITATMAAQVLYILSLLCSKISIILFHLTDDNWKETRSQLMKRVAVSLIAFISIYSTGGLIAVLVQCAFLDDWQGDQRDYSASYHVRGIMMGIGVVDVLTLVATMFIAYPVLRWQLRDQRDKFPRAKVIACAVFGALSFPLTIVRAPLSVNPSQPRIALPLVSLLTLTVLLLSALLLHPSGLLLPTTRSETIEEIAKLEPSEWRDRCGLAATPAAAAAATAGRGRSRNRNVSSTDMSINSNTRLFSERDRLERSRTPAPSSIFTMSESDKGEKIEIQVQYEVTRTVETRKNKNQQPRSIGEEKVLERQASG